MEKKINYNEKKFCAEKLNFGLLPKYIARLGSWAGRWARLLGVQALGARGVRSRACVGARERAQADAGAREAHGAGRGGRRGRARSTRGRAG